MPDRTQSRLSLGKVGRRVVEGAFDGGDIEDQMQVEIDTDFVGRVRLRFRRQCYRRPRGKTSYFAWHCCYAESA